MVMKVNIFVKEVIQTETKFSWKFAHDFSLLWVGKNKR